MRDGAFILAEYHAGIKVIFTKSYNNYNNKIIIAKYQVFYRCIFLEGLHPRHMDVPQARD